MGVTVVDEDLGDCPVLLCELRYSWVRETLDESHLSVYIYSVVRFPLTEIDKLRSEPGRRSRLGERRSRPTVALLR